MNLQTNLVDTITLILLYAHFSYCRIKSNLFPQVIRNWMLVTVDPCWNCTSIYCYPGWDWVQIITWTLHDSPIFQIQAYAPVFFPTFSICRRQASLVLHNYWLQFTECSPCRTTNARWRAGRYCHDHHSDNVEKFHMPNNWKACHQSAKSCSRVK